MKYIRRTLLMLTTTLLAVVTNTRAAIAGPAPLIEPEPSTTNGGGGTAATADGFLDSWLQVTLAVVVVAAVGAIVVYGASRLRNHALTTA